MKRTTLTVLMAVLALGATSAAADTSASRTIRESYEVAADARVAVDNVFGSIEVVGTRGPTVELTVVETITADDQEALETARREVELLIDHSEPLLDLFVDGPFRDRDDRRGWSKRSWRPRYQVTYEFELRVPEGVRLELRTVTDGEIRVDGVRGDFDISNVNGGIEMHGLGGSGRIRTVNGPIVAGFVASPGARSEFTTVNGNVDVTFPSDLSADLQLKTQFGELWSDFDVQSLPMEPMVRKTKGGKTVIKRGGTVVRVADGGPRLSFETLNGDVLIRKAR